jgi:hypothetical protein
MDMGQNPVPPVNLKVDGHPLYHMISRFWPIPSWVSATKIWDFRDAVWDMGNLAIQPRWISKKRRGLNQTINGTWWLEFEENAHLKT